MAAEGYGVLTAQFIRTHARPTRRSIWEGEGRSNKLDRAQKQCIMQHLKVCRYTIHPLNAQRPYTCSICLTSRLTQLTLRSNNFAGSCFSASRGTSLLAFNDRVNALMCLAVVPTFQQPTGLHATCLAARGTAAARSGTFLPQLPCWSPNLPASGWPACRCSKKLHFPASAVCKALQSVLPSPSAVPERPFTGAVYHCHYV